MIPVRPCNHRSCGILREFATLCGAKDAASIDCRYPIMPAKMAAIRRDHRRRPKSLHAARRLRGAE